MINTDVYLRKKLTDLTSVFGNETLKVYADYYASVGSDQLKYIFSLLHYELNEHLIVLNNRINSGHYLAHDSRNLIHIIESIRLIEANLRNTKFSFNIDNYYEQVIADCKGFLSDTRGSAIPNNFTEIRIIENKPVFALATTTSIKRSQEKFFQTKLIGEGSYAKVFKYKDTHYNQSFAIKRAKSDLTSEELFRFKTEYAELSKLNSPYIIKVYNFNEEKNEYTMEYAPTTLQEHINQNNTKLNLTQRLALISQILKAFSYIHSKQILHRDISLQNILIRKYDDITIIKVSDFGLVKLPDSQLTREGTDIKGSLNDPNLTEVGFENYEIQHEIYALTRVIHFVLTGKTSNFNYSNYNVKAFFLRGTSPDLKKRFRNIEELSKEFNNIKLEILNEKVLI